MAGATFWADSFLPRPAILFLKTLAGVLLRRAVRTFGSILKRSAQTALPSASVSSPLRQQAAIRVMRTAEAEHSAEL